MNGELCSKCKREPSLSYHRYCYACQRIACGRPVKPKFHRDPNNKTLCSKCKEKPRLSYHRYCQECKNKAVRLRAKSKGSHWKSYTHEYRRRSTVRTFIHNLIKRGHLKPKPCLVCGKETSEIHHWDYERMTLNVDWFCHEHHMLAEQMKKKGLTKEHIVAYLLNSSVSAEVATPPPNDAGPFRFVS